MEISSGYRGTILKRTRIVSRDDGSLSTPDEFETPLTAEETVAQLWLACDLWEGSSAMPGTFYWWSLRAQHFLVGRSKGPWRRRMSRWWPNTSAQRTVESEQ